MAAAHNEPTFYTQVYDGDTFGFDKMQGIIKNAILHQMHHVTNKLSVAEIGGNWNLRICRLDISEHSNRSYYLQYNIISGRSRLIIKVPAGYLHQAPKNAEEITTKATQIEKHIRRYVTLMNDDMKWHTILATVGERDALQETLNGLASMDEPMDEPIYAHKGGAYKITKSQYTALCAPHPTQNQSAMR